MVLLQVYAIMIDNFFAKRDKIFNPESSQIQEFMLVQNTSGSGRVVTVYSFANVGQYVGRLENVFFSVQLLGSHLTHNRQNFLRWLVTSILAFLDGF
jgi:hypothetical protein